MTKPRLPLATLPLVGAAVLGGCAIDGGRPPAVAYVPAPCGVPGAVRVVAVAPPAAPVPTTVEAGTGAAPDLPSAPPPPVATTADGTPPPADERCLVAVAARGGYPSGYGYPGYYGAPFYGALGLGIGFGGHHVRRGHLRAGHIGAGHGVGHSGGHGGGGHH